MIRIICVTLFIIHAVSCTETSNNTVLDSGKICTPISSSSALKKELTVEVEGETAQMVEELSDLVKLGDPMKYLHWNTQKAEVFKSRLGVGDNNQQVSNYLNYCRQLLFAGESRLCIEKLNKWIGRQTYEEAINERTKVVFDLLALAYLRFGEQQNCLTNHTSQSCIIPLQKEGIHKLRVGSEKAIELYEVLNEKFPSYQYRYLLNIAHMTLGNYPEKVPADYFMKIPGEWEQEDFPAFQDVAMNVGLAQDDISGGVSIDDFNNDGYLDVFATSYGMNDNVQLFLNNQKGGFDNVTQNAGLNGIVSGLNCVHADYDNDGFKDIFVLRGAWLGSSGNHPNSLLKNMGDGTFRDVSRSANVLSYHPTQTASWGDYNNDGFLDLFVGNERDAENSNQCELYHNNGDGTFSEVAASLGLNVSKFVKGVCWGDINNDGWQDLYISVLGDENLLFKNTGGRFEEIAKKANVNEPKHSFPCWFWDVNNDGFQDILVASYDARFFNNVSEAFGTELATGQVITDKTKLFLNNGDETFTDATNAYGLDKVMFAMGVNFGDLDNDGFLDFYVGTGAPSLDAIVPNRMFRNVNGKRFEEVTSAGNFGHIQKGHGIAFADLDRDGDQDIYEVMGGAFEGDNYRNLLYENPISKNNWIVIELEGTNSNRDALGVRIELTLDNGSKLHRVVSTGGSFGASPLEQSFGLGNAESIKELKIHWMNKESQTFNDISSNQKIRIQEGKDDYEKVEYSYVPFNSHH